MAHLILRHSAHNGRRGGSFIYKYSPMPLSYAELERFYQSGETLHMPALPRLLSHRAFHPVEGVSAWLGIGPVGFVGRREKTKHRLPAVLTGRIHGALDVVGHAGGAIRNAEGEKTIRDRGALEHGPRLRGEFPMPQIFCRTCREWQRRVGIQVLHRGHSSRKRCIGIWPEAANSPQIAPTIQAIGSQEILLRTGK